MFLPTPPPTKKKRTTTITKTTKNTTDAKHQQCFGVESVPLTRCYRSSTIGICRPFVLASWPADTWSAIISYNNVISSSEERCSFLRCEAVIKGCGFCRWNLAESTILKSKDVAIHHWLIKLSSQNKILYLKQWSQWQWYSLSRSLSLISLNSARFDLLKLISPKWLK